MPLPPKQSSRNRSADLSDDWKVAPLDSAVDWSEMRHCSEAFRSAHRALVFTDELTFFLEAFFFRERERCSVVDKLHQLDDVPPRLRRLRSGRRLWSCSGGDVFRCICLHLCRNCAFRPSSVSSGSHKSDANTMRTPTSTAALPLGQCYDNSARSCLSVCVFSRCLASRWKNHH